MKYVLTLYLISFFSMSYGQDNTVQWLTFPELEKALANKPKKVLVHFYADWCAYCHKMEKEVYAKSEISKALNSQYYAVKFNVESTDSIQFGGQVFKNINVGKKRNPYHQIPEFLAGRENKPLELPATVILDEQFNITQRYYRYIPPKEILTILSN